MQNLVLVHSAARPTPLQSGFNARDRIALTCWMQRADDHGYRRVVVEDGRSDGRPEDAGYVLVYAPGRQWASWGVARGPLGVVIWHCGTGADLGRFPTMTEALDSLPACRRTVDRPVIGSPEQPSAKPPAARPRFALVHSA